MYQWQEGIRRDWLRLLDVDGAWHAFPIEEIVRMVEQDDVRQPAFETETRQVTHILLRTDNAWIVTEDRLDDLLNTILGGNRSS